MFKTSKLVALFVLVSSMMFGCVYNTYNTSNEQAAPASSNSAAPSASATTPSIDDAATQSGTLAFALDTSTPEPQLVSPGSSNVPALYLTVSAGGSGACVHSIDVHRYGVSGDGVLERATFYDMTNKPWTPLSSALFGGSVAHVDHAAGASVVLFCLAGGETRRFAITVDVPASAAPGQMFSLGIESAQDINTDGDSAIGAFPIIGNSFAVAAN